MAIIPYSKQKINSADIDAVCQTLGSDFITQGPKIEEFERALADYCKSKYAVAVSNGSAALHLAALAIGLRPGAEVITTPITFLATANAAIYAGTTPVFADIDYDTVNIDPQSIKNLITKRTKAIFPVDFAGLPADMSQIFEMAKRRGLKVVEDASHALGSQYGRKKVGSCQFSDMTTFSFHPVKHITTGEGGCITTNSKVYYEKLKALRSHGVYRTPAAQRKFGKWYYEMKDLGFNYRITDFQCALGLSQLQKLDEFIKQRSRIAQQYNEAFSELDDYLKIPAQKIAPDKQYVWHLYLLRIKLEKPGSIRRRLFEYLWANEIHAQVHYIPIYKQPFYQKLFSNKIIRCPNAERYYEEVLSLPLFPTLTNDEVMRTIAAVKDFFKNSPLVGQRYQKGRRAISHLAGEQA